MSAAGSGPHAPAPRVDPPHRLRSSGAAALLPVPPTPLTQVSAAATRLRLVPTSRRLPAITIASGPSLAIGRSPTEADVLTEFLPETTENLKRTARLGRVHVLARRVDGWPCFWDGDGRSPSLNGSSLDDRPLRADTGMRSLEESVLRLGRRYALRVVCLPTPAALGAPAGDSAGPACTVLFQFDQLAPTRLTAWLGESVGLVVASDGLAWSGPRDPRPALRLGRGETGFWITNLALPSAALRVRGELAPPGAAMPLRHGETLEIERLRYRVETYA